MSKKSKKEEEKDKKAVNAKERGTTNELEILKIVLMENPVLQKRVMEKMRVHRALSKDSGKEPKKRSDD